MGMGGEVDEKKHDIYIHSKKKCKPEHQHIIIIKNRTISNHVFAFLNEHSPYPKPLLSLVE